MNNLVENSLKIKGLASIFLQLMRGTNLLLEYLKDENIPESITQQLQSIVKFSSEFRRDALALSEQNLMDENIITERFQAWSRAADASIQGAWLLADHVLPQIATERHQGLTFLSDGFKALRWDIPYSYVIAVHSGTMPEFQGKNRAILEFPYLPHAVLGIVEQNNKVTIIDNTPFSYGSNIGMTEYIEKVKLADDVQNPQCTDVRILPNEMVSLLLETYFSKTGRA